MGDTKFTLIELHFDGEAQFELGSIGKALPIGGESTDTERESETEESVAASEDSGGSGKSAVGALVALVVLIAIAAAARKLRGDDERPAFETEEEPDVIVN